MLPNFPSLVAAAGGNGEDESMILSLSKFPEPGARASFRQIEQFWDLMSYERMFISFAGPPNAWTAAQNLFKPTCLRD